MIEDRRKILVAAMQDENEQIRASAAEAMEFLELRGRLDHFAKTLDEGEKTEKLKAVYALGNLRGDDIVKLLLKATKDEIEDVRASAVRALGKFADNRILPNLIECLKDESPIVQRVAIDAIASFKDPQLIVPLIDMMKSTDAGVVERSIHAVSSSGSKKVEEAMIFFIRKGNTTMKSLAMKAIGIMES